MKQKEILLRNDHLKKIEQRNLAGGFLDSHASETEELKHFVLDTDHKPEVKNTQIVR